MNVELMKFNFSPLLNLAQISLKTVLLLFWLQFLNNYYFYCLLYFEY